MNDADLILRVDNGAFFHLLSVDIGAVSRMSTLAFIMVLMRFVYDS